MSTLGQRIYKLRRDKKLSRDALGAKIGVSKTAIKNWEDDDNIPKHEYLDALSLFFKCSLDYLVDGVGDGDNFKAVPPRPARQVPVLNYVQAGGFSDYFDDAIPDRTESVPDDVVGDNLFWLEINGLSMVPDFYPKDLILINRDLQPNPGDFVVAIKNGEKSVTFKKWRPRGFDDDGKEYCELVPSNPDFPTIDSRHMPFEICGVAVRYLKNLR